MFTLVFRRFARSSYARKLLLFTYSQHLYIYTHSRAHNNYYNTVFVALNLNVSTDHGYRVGNKWYSCSLAENEHKLPHWRLSDP